MNDDDDYREDLIEHVFVDCETCGEELAVPEDIVDEIPCPACGRAWCGDCVCKCGEKPD